MIVCYCSSVVQLLKHIKEKVNNRILSIVTNHPQSYEEQSYSVRSIGDCNFIMTCQVQLLYEDVRHAIFYRTT